MSPQHQEIESLCLKGLQDAGLSHLIKTVFPHFSYDGSTAVFIFWAEAELPVLIEGPDEELPALVLEGVQQQAEQWQQAS